MNIDKIKEAFVKYAIEKYGEHTVKTEGMSGELSGKGYQDREEDYIAGVEYGLKQNRIDTLVGLGKEQWENATFEDIMKHIGTELANLGVNDMSEPIIRELENEELMMLHLKCKIAMGNFKVANRIMQDFDKTSKIILQKLKDLIQKREEERQEIVKEYNEKLKEIRKQSDE